MSFSSKSKANGRCERFYYSELPLQTSVNVDYELLVNHSKMKLACGSLDNVTLLTNSEVLLLSIHI